MIKYFLCFLLFVSTLTSQAKEIYYGSSPELVSVSQETIFRFHKQVRTISQAHKFEIKPADPNDPDYSLLSIRPRFTKGTSKVAFVLSDGNVVTLRLRIVKNKNSSIDPFYDLKPKSLLIERSEKNLPVITSFDLMKSIDRDDSVMGYQRKIENKKLPAIGKNNNVRARLIRSYSGKKYRGFVIELENHCATKSYKIEVDKLKFKDSPLAIISLVDDEVLFPRGSGPQRTLLKIVAKSTASVSDLVLPVFIQNEKKGTKI